MYLNGGRVNTGIDALEWAKKPRSLVQARYFLQVWTVMGLKQDTILNLQDVFRKMQKIPVIASGGAGKMEHFLDAFTEGKADAVLAASLFHFREIEIND